VTENRYHITRENFRIVYPIMEPLFRVHYKEMQDRLAGDGVLIGDFNPRLAEYFRAADADYLKTFVVWHEESPVGYAMIYLTNDMHNGDFIAQEDAIYVLPQHRNGTGRFLIKEIMAFLKDAGVKRAYINATTDLRIVPMMKRFGYKEVASAMMYVF
jgi:GNAT superfamily N-acetyltransferase